MGILRLLLCCLVWWGSVSLAMAEPPWLVVRTRTYPHVVGLGQPLTHSAWIRVKPGYQLTIPPRSQLGRAALLSAPKLRKSRMEANTYVVTLSLAIYLVQRYGAYALPPLEVALRSPSGNLQYAKLPQVRFELVERYAGTKTFQLKDDPQLSPQLLRKQGQTPFSHEWRPPPVKWKAKPTSSSWNVVTLAGSSLLAFAFALLVLLLWQRHQRRKAEALQPPSPFDVAKQQLHVLKGAESPTVDSYRESLDKGLHVMRTYLEQRLSLPVHHLTETELEQTLRESLLSRFPLQESWLTTFHTLLQTRQTYCYQPYPQADFSMVVATDLLGLIETLEAHATQEEERKRLAKERI